MVRASSRVCRTLSERVNLSQPCAWRHRQQGDSSEECERGGPVRDPAKRLSGNPETEHPGLRPAWVRWQEGAYSMYASPGLSWAVLQTAKTSNHYIPRS